MGRVISLINTTPDGFVDARYVTPDAEYFDFILGLLTDIDTVAFGRTSFELFQGIWPPRMDPNKATAWQLKMAKALHEIPKTVYSTTLKTTTWNNSTIVRKVSIDQVNAYKSNDKGGLLIFASLSLVATMTEMNLIDDYYFCVQPLIAGGGEVRLFDRVNLRSELRLRYVKSTSFASGVHIIHYERERSLA
jgi:dihydrofolate reductase